MRGPEQVSEAVAEKAQIPGVVIGLLVALACAAIFVAGFLVGMPELSYFTAGAVIVGGAVAVT
ncbi:MAG TPA: hypothetical protein VJW20_17180 [Candidatus Angelobacter sp.]|nr:hypothetical protein [Candidatus Angelobacter sp.]